MKKIIISCSVLLVLSLLVASFTSCSGNKNGETTTSANDSSINTAAGFTAQISSEEAVILKDGKEFQRVVFPKNNDFTVDVAFAQEHYEFIDMNFDGVSDFYIAASKNGEVINFLCWIYNETSGKFEHSGMLSALKNISVDSDNQAIYAVVHFEGTERVVCYKWVDGQLRINEQYDVTDDTLPAEITQSVQNNQIGTDKKPAQTEAEKTTSSKAEKPTTEKNENKEPTTEKKPNPVTTTAPSKSEGVTLASGDIDDGWY